MAVEAPISKYKKNNLKIYIVFCIGIAIWCAYDGYFNDKWIAEHKNPDGSPQPYLTFNRNAPPFFAGAAVLLVGYLFAVRNKKIIAEENELVLSKKEKISYDSIQKIDKTHFKKKGRFVITYKNKCGKEVSHKLSDRTYDNLPAILEKLVAKIS
ncbi:MAG: hypothetical protein JSV82_00910 [Planctomycetota bacterium]|nr:MAG: hypothetical protein JSV82_00910 [Planctomycetota bacterium]